LNHEEQYSIWPTERENAPGWQDAGFRGSKADVLVFIKEHWTDMRPLSLRQQMMGAQQSAITTDTARHSSGPISEAAGSPIANVTSEQASVAPAVAAAIPPIVTNVKRGWFSRRRNTKAADTAVPVTADSSINDAASGIPQKRGLFGKRHTS
jgi:MbtH protein